ncbi:Cleft lip and palate transmembrane protein 1 like protein [Cichlidogyrus casuarinus]|uniref:Cleft lip and palate transmembrane protein 1 like protein n=1 Tax=Cichlidogyrus casuarinus TaxID=1844966 RepID=A0ABD2QM76_9PLAT
MAQERDSALSRTATNASNQVVSTASQNDNQSAENEVSNPQNNQQEQQNQMNANQFRMSKWGMFKSFLIRLVIMYLISSFFRQQKNPSVDPGNKFAASSVSMGPASNLLVSNEILDLYLFLSETKNLLLNKSTTPFWVKKGIGYGNWNSGPNQDGSYYFEKNISTTDSLMNNGSLYLHVYFVKSGLKPNPDAENGLYSNKYTIYNWKKLTKQRRISLKRTTNLLTGESEVPKERRHDPTIHAADLKFLPPTSHWHPNITINLIEDYTPWTKGSLPSPLAENVQFYEPTNQYYPIVYLNDYWNLNEDYYPINQTTKELTLAVTFAPMSLIKWQMYAAQALRKQWYSQFFSAASSLPKDSNETLSFHENLLSSIQGGPAWLDEDGIPILSQDEETEQDQMKKTMLETNPYLLALTVVVSLAHAVFEMLAFKNDIQFWNSRTTLAGLSVQSVLFNVFQSGIVVLYVLDNDTNFVIKVSVVIGACIEAWKVFKVLKFRVIWPSQRQEETSIVVPRWLPRVEWAYEESYVESETAVYDKMAFKYLGWVLFPLLGGYCVYSLVYLEHRSWYSWVLSMLYGFMLTFGFITMTPQLFINYKLKSVAHLPWRMLTYKALNTFIDDLFAFIIKAPTLYRLGCLRDDVIFFIYLYQRWIYPTDPTRVNEFGVSQDMLDKHAAKKEKDSIEPNTNPSETATPEAAGDQQVRRRQPATD